MYLILIKSNCTLHLTLSWLTKHLWHNHTIRRTVVVTQLTHICVICRLANWFSTSPTVMTAIGLKSTVVVKFVTKVTVWKRHSIPEGLHVWVMMELSSEWHNYTKTWLPTDNTTSLFRRDVSFAKCSLWGLKSIIKGSMKLFTLDDGSSGTTRPSTHGHIPENLNLLPCFFFF